MSSMWALGVTGTYLGDYFVSSPSTCRDVGADGRAQGILMDVSDFRRGYARAVANPSERRTRSRASPSTSPPTQCTTARPSPSSRPHSGLSPSPPAAPQFSLTLNHRYESPAGLLLTILVFVEYKIALRYEEYASTSLPLLAQADPAQAFHRRHLRRARSCALQAGA